MIRVLCIDNLHAFEVAPDAADRSCPECGCSHVRLAAEPVPEGVQVVRRTPRTRVQVERGRHKVGNAPTWLDDRKTFVETARKLAPELSDAELKTSVERWFPNG